MTSWFRHVLRRSFFEFDEDDFQSYMSSSLLNGKNDSNDDVITTRETHTWILKKNMYMFSLRGWDNVHIYLWIMKDYAWTSDSTPLAWFFGLSALSWCVVLQWVAYTQSDFEEMYFLVSMILWLSANFWWMAGEERIAGDDDVNSVQSSYMMMSALIVLIVFYLVIKPCGWLRSSPEITAQLESAGLYPRFRCLSNWRQYEYLHMLCWCMKDLAWNLMQKELWIFALIPTFLIGADFMWESWRMGFIVDFAHYAAQLLWVFGNAAWSYGELFTVYDDAYPVTDASPLALKTGRWWASVLLLSSFIPIVILYFVWIPWVISRASQEISVKEETYYSEQECESHGSEFRPKDTNKDFTSPISPVTLSGSPTGNMGASVRNNAASGATPEGRYSTAVRESSAVRESTVEV
jgi:hypothetical protein